MTAKSDRPRRPAARRGWRLLLRLLRPQGRLLLLAAGLATLAAGIELLPYWLVYRMVAALLAPAQDLATLLQLAALIFAAVLLRLLLYGCANVASHAAAFRLQRDLRVGLLRSLQEQPLGAVEGRRGDLKKTLVDDVGGLEGLVGHTLPDAIAGLAMPLLAAPLLLALDWRMALASLALLPLAFWAQRRAFADLGPIQARWHAAESAANAGLLSYLGGIATLKACNRLASSLAGLRLAVHALSDLADEVTRRTALPYALFFVALSTNLLVVLPVGLLLHAAGGLDAEELALFALLGAGLTAPLLRVLHAFGALQRQMQAAERIVALQEAPRLPQPAVGREPRGHDISFRGVTFAYGADRQALEAVELTIPAGRLTAVVGPSGAGKSTLLRLVARFWDVEVGRIEIGGVDLREIDPARLQALVALVPQDPFLFRGTLRENLEMAAPDAAPADLAAAIEAAGLTDCVARLPQGLGTPLGERGTRLSGGERQRLAIARALLKKAPILLLDEPTAFADPESALAVQTAIARLAGDKTLVVVTHGLGTIRQADRIVVLRRGRIDAVGTHDRLLQGSAVYRRLWEARSRAKGWALRRSPAAGPAG